MPLNLMTFSGTIFSSYIALMIWFEIELCPQPWQSVLGLPRYSFFIRPARFTFAGAPAMGSGCVICVLLSLSYFFLDNFFVKGLPVLDVIFFIILTAVFFGAAFMDFVLTAADLALRLLLPFPLDFTGATYFARIPSRTHLAEAGMPSPYATDLK